MKGFRDYVIEITIHNDVGDWSDRHALSLILMQNSISNSRLYVALATDVSGRGKGLLFSRWGTGDLANAKYTLPEGWSESSGGDFIGVRRLYDWKAGDYRVRLAPDYLESDGEWFSLWITDLGTDQTTWIGSLKFPLLDGTALMQPSSSATIELQGIEPIRPIDVPQWHVSFNRPSGDNVFAEWGATTYPFDDHVNALPNSDVRYDESEDKAHLVLGGSTERKSPAGNSSFKAISDRESIPIPSRPPTPSPTPTPRPELPAVLPDVQASAAEARQRQDETVRNSLNELRKSMPKPASKIRNFRWIKDGIEGSAEFNAAMGLIRLADTGLTDDLVGQSWVREGRNYPALESLWILKGSYPEKFETIWSHPTISDGISEKEAKIVAALHSVSDASALEVLLDPEQVTLEERTIELPLAGETELTVIQTDSKADYAMDSLERSVRSIEEFMGLPFPLRQVILLFDDALDARGRNYSTHVSIKTKELDEGRESTLTLIAHEVGHYYWLGLPRWQSEGAAHFMAAVSDDTLLGPLISLSCPQTQSIAEFEEFEREYSTPGEVHECNYSLGERIFRDLYRNLDETAFRLAFRRLHLHTLYDSPDECESQKSTNCHMKEAFTAHATQQASTAVESVIGRWYDLPRPFPISWRTDTPVNTDIPNINGRIEEAYLSLTRGGRAVSEIIIGPNRNPGAYLNLDYSYENTGGFRYLPIEMELYLDDGSEIHRTLVDLLVLPVPAGAGRKSHIIHVPFWRDAGRYWVQIHHAEQKIVEATFNAIPEPDPHKIQGKVSDTEDQPPDYVTIQITKGEDRFWVDVGRDGTFEAEVPPGSYRLEILIPLITEESIWWKFVGWYDGSGVTTEPSNAYDVVIDRADLDGVEIVLPTDAESLICPSGEDRSRKTGRCP